jgi:hypothetical protein
VVDRETDVCVCVCAVQERVFRACSCREHGRSAVFLILQVLMAFGLGIRCRVKQSGQLADVVAKTPHTQD